MSAGKSLLHDLLAKVDASNWDAMSGDYLRGYSQAMDEIHELISEYQDQIYADGKA